jgi:enamine deaminase RidA (YjgF/YER057c/UK114 family)
VSKTGVNPPTVFPALDHGFSQGVLASGRKTLYFSGQVAWDPQRRLVGEGDLEKQAVQSFRNVQAVVEAAGGTLSDVVSLRIYLVDYAPEKAAALGRALKLFFRADPRPASTWVGVAALANPAFLIEIEGTAVLD